MAKQYTKLHSGARERERKWSTLNLFIKLTKLLFLKNLSRGIGDNLEILHLNNFFLEIFVPNSLL